MRHSVSCILILLLFLSLLSGCAGQTAAPAATSAPAEVITISDEASSSPAPVPTAAPTKEPEWDEAALWQALSELVFEFSSGAGGWGTELYIDRDGSFWGTYHDSDMGDIGEGYPNGTLYLCQFYGRFGQAELLDGGAVRLQIEDLHCLKEEGEEILDGVRTIYSQPYGLTGDGRFTLYPPATLRSALSEELLGWVRWAQGDSAQYTEDQLGFYTLCNESEQQAFSSMRLSDGGRTIRQRVSEAVRTAAPLEAKLQQDLSQMELNDTAGAVYAAWDAALNDVWQQLGAMLDAENFQRLTAAERAWIDRKEAAIHEASDLYREGSIYPLIYYSTAADWTRSRLFTLSEWLH